MIIDYEGSPVFDCLYKGEYYTVKSEDNGMVTIEKPNTVIGSKAKIQTEVVDYNLLEKENDHFMKILLNSI